MTGEAERLADDLERAIARFDKACADGDVALTTMMDVAIKAIVRQGLPLILRHLRAGSDAAVERVARHLCAKYDFGHGADMTDADWQGYREAARAAIRAAVEP